MKMGYVAHVLRVVYMLFILRDIVQANWFSASFHGVIFVILAFFAFAGRLDWRYAYVDSALLALFIGSQLAPLFGIELKSSFLGPDKAFHFTGGLLLAGVAYVFYRQHIKNIYVLCASIIIFSLALGAAWEVFEWLYFLIDATSMPITLGDSMLDLIADTLGGCVTAVVVWLRHQ